MVKKTKYFLKSIEIQMHRLKWASIHISALRDQISCFDHVSTSGMACIGQSVMTSVVKFHKLTVWTEHCQEQFPHVSSVLCYRVMGCKSPPEIKKCGCGRSHSLIGPFKSFDSHSKRRIFFFFKLLHHNSDEA